MAYLPEIYDDANWTYQSNKYKYRNVARNVHRTSDNKLKVHNNKIIVTCDWPQRLCLTFKDIREDSPGCQYSYDYSCDAPAWINPNRKFIVYKIMDFDGQVMYECINENWVVTLAIRYVTGSNRMFMPRGVWVSLVRITDQMGGEDEDYPTNCSCPIFLVGSEFMYETPFWDGNARYYDENENYCFGDMVLKYRNDGDNQEDYEYYLCIKDRIATNAYGTWEGTTQPDNWINDHVYQIGDRVLGTDGLHYRCGEVHKSSSTNKPTSGDYWQSRWTLESNHYGSGIDIVTGTDGNYHTCKWPHSGSSIFKPITGTKWSDVWGTAAGIWSSSIAYTWGQRPIYNGKVVESKQSPNLNHVPQIDNLCRFDWWWKYCDFYNFKTWSSGEFYSTKLSRVVGTDGNFYRCKKTHFPYDDRRPVTGSNWEMYWDLEQKPNTPETGIDWQTYWKKIKCKTPFEEGVYFLNQLENEFAWGTWGRVEISKDIQSYQTWQPDYEYNVGDMVIGSDQNIYACEIHHTSTINDCPITGANWDDYWVLAECSG
jgi:hypothetical protein